MLKLFNKTFVRLLFAAFLLAFLAIPLSPTITHAQSSFTCDDGRIYTGAPNATKAQVCADIEDTSEPCRNPDLNKENCGIVAYIVRTINFLSAIVGIVIVIVIAVGGVQYTTSRDNPQATAAAKGRITNAILSLVFYLFIYAFLQWLVPGGIF